MSSLEGESVEYKQFKELETSDYNEETLSVIYTGLSKLLQSALKHPPASLKQEVGKTVISLLTVTHVVANASDDFLKHVGKRGCC